MGPRGVSRLLMVGGWEGKVEEGEGGEGAKERREDTIGFNLIVVVVQVVIVVVLHRRCST